MYLLIAFIFGAIFGFYVNESILPLLLKKESFIEKQQDKAIQNHFSLQPNEYTYFYEGVDDYYILTHGKKEYRIKFSKNRPYSIIYEQEVTLET